MKRKFSLMGRVAIALVLALSLCLMSAVPVMATHTSTAVIEFADGESRVVSMSSILDVTVKNPGASTNNIKTVKIDFTGTGFTGIGEGTKPGSWAGVVNDFVVTYTHATGFKGEKTFHPVVTNPATAGVATNPVVTTTDVDANVKATLDATELTGWIGYTAVTAGLPDPEITIEYATPGYSGAPLTVAVSGAAIEVTFATGKEAEGSISKASEVAAAINLDADAAKLVFAAVAVGKGTEVVPKMDSTPLTGGITSTADFPCVESGTLKVIAVPPTIWVDDDGSGANLGTEAEPVATIAQGLLLASDYGTVNVLPGTYTLDATLSITQVGLTLQSTGGAPVTFIDAGSLTAPLIGIAAAAVTVDGFTIGDVPTVYSGIHIVSEDGATVKNNIITAAAGGDVIGIIIAHADGATVTGNEIGGQGSDEGKCNIYLNNVSDCTLSINTLNSGINLWADPNAGALIEGLTITDNTFTAQDNTGCGAINVMGPGNNGEATLDDSLIEGNTLSGRLYGIWVGAITNLTVTNVTITGNDITDNETAGIQIEDGVTWGTGNTISNNNIYGNVDYGINNLMAATIIDAENNWWGDASGPLQAITNTGGKGDKVSDNVDYRPYLSAEYGVEPVAPVTTIDLVKGWNLISLPLIPEDSTIETVLTGVTVDSVHAYDTATKVWTSYANVTGDKLEEMVDGKGYFVKMTAGGTLIALGAEQPAPPAAPKDYSVIEGWNLIGFKSTTAKTASDYLAAIISKVTLIYSFDAVGQYYVTVQPSQTLNPGKGYWIAVTAPGTIYP